MNKNPLYLLEPQVSTKVTYIQTTEKGSTSVITEETSIALSQATSSSNEVISSTPHVPTTFHTETTTKFLTFGSTAATPSFFDSYYPILLGIFGVCSLFLIIFTIYVGIHVHTKCSKRKASKQRQKTSVEPNDVYQEISELGTLGNITRYDPLNSNKPTTNREYQAVVSSSHIQASTPSFSIENTSGYSKVDDKDQVLLQSHEIVPSISVKESRYISSPTSQRKPNRTECQPKIDMNRKSPPRDKDDYILPTFEGCRKEISISGSPCTSSLLSSNETHSDSAETPGVYSTINDDTVNEYLIVIPN